MAPQALSRASPVWIGLVTLVGPAAALHVAELPTTDVSHWPAAPALSLSVSGGVNVGWDLHATTRNWRFAAERVNGFPREGEGYATLYLNGVRAGRLYAPWHHLGVLRPGRYEVEVRLVGNDHRPLARGAAPVAARTVLVVPGPVVP